MTTTASMTDGHTARRTLAYRYHNIEPGPYDYSPARDQWRVEQALARALDRHDTVGAAVAEVNAEHGWDLDGCMVLLLVDWADAIHAYGGAATGAFHAAVDNYCITLRNLAGGVHAYVGRHRDGRTARTSDHTGRHREDVVAWIRAQESAAVA